MSEQSQIEQTEQEQQEQQEVQTPEIQAEEQQAEPEQQPEGSDELAGIMAGYNKTPQFQQEKKQEEEAPAQAMPQVIAGLQEDEVVAKLKKVDELEEMLNSRLQKVNNLVGNLKQRLDAIPKDTPKSEVRAITSDSMKKLRELGFDEIADALAEDLNGALSVQSAPQVDVGEAIKSAMREMSIQELEDLHPGWQEITASKDGVFKSQGFSTWFNTLPKEMQEKVITSESVAFVSRALDTFKEWEKNKADKEAQARKTSESRLNRAMTPTQGKAAATPSRLPDDVGLWNGYNKGPKPLQRN